MFRLRPLDPREGIFELTGTKWQEGHFAQPQVARRAMYMEVLSESIYSVPQKEILNIDGKRSAVK